MNPFELTVVRVVRTVVRVESDQEPWQNGQIISQEDIETEIIARKKVRL